MNKNPMVGRIIAPGAAIFYGFDTILSRLACATGTTPVSLLSPERISGMALIVPALFLSQWKLPRIDAKTAVVPGD